MQILCSYFLLREETYEKGGLLNIEMVIDHGEKGDWDKQTNAVLIHVYSDEASVILNIAVNTSCATAASIYGDLR